MTYSKKITYLITLSVALVLCTVAVVGVITWFVYIDGRVAAMLSTRVVDAREESSYAALQALREEERVTALERAVVRALAVDELTLPRFLTEFERTGVTVQSIQSDTAAGMFVINATYSGERAVALRVVQRITELPYALTVSAFTMTAGKQDNWDISMRVRVVQI